MYRRLSSVVALGIVVILSCTGCTVKEDRSVCPCVLMLDFSRVDPGRADSVSLSVLSADDFYHGDVVYSHSYQDVYSVEVPKSGVWVNVYSVENGYEDFSSMMSPDGASLSIPLGDECPAVDKFSYFADTASETLYVPVIPGKNYCTLMIHMLADPLSELSLAVDGTVCGYGKDGRPAAGDFHCALYPDEEGYCDVRIPRQTDGSLRLVISDGDGILREFAIGEYIIGSGYDWTAYDLEDVTIDIDYSKADVTFIVNEWEKTIDMEVEI